MAQDLSLESRIIAVADVYGSLSEDRPYRPGLELDQIVSIMEELTPNKLDMDCFEAVISVATDRREVAFAPTVLSAQRPLVYAAV